MAYMEVSRVEVTEVIRRWQAGGSQRHISAAIGMSRSTVRKYITAAVQAGLRQDGAPPTEEQLTSLVRMNVSGPRTVEIPTEDTLAPWADQVYQWLTAERLQITRIQELLSARGCQGGILKKCVNSQAVYALSEQHGLKARERGYTAHEEGKHWE